MNKAILVIDMPDTCGRCQLCQGISTNGEYVCSILNEDGNERGYDDGKYSKPDWCPLKLIPEKKLIWYDDERSDLERGYNDCLCDIIGWKQYKEL